MSRRALDPYAFDADSRSDAADAFERVPLVSSWPASAIGAVAEKLGNLFYAGHANVLMVPGAGGFILDPATGTRSAEVMWNGICCRVTVGPE